MAHVCRQRLSARHCQENRAQHKQPRHAVLDQKGYGIPGIEGQQDFGRGDEIEQANPTNR